MAIKLQNKVWYKTIKGYYRKMRKKSQSNRSSVQDTCILPATIANERAVQRF